MKDKFNFLSILFKLILFVSCLFVFLDKVDFSLKELSLLCCISLITDFMRYINKSVTKIENKKEDTIYGESKFN